MTPVYTSSATKRLVLKFVLDNIDYRKRCLYLQDIISLGKENPVWQQALIIFLDAPLNRSSPRAFSKN